MIFKTYCISELVDEISMGPFGSNIKVECFVDEGIPVLNGSNLEGYELKENSFRFVTKEKADSLNKANAYRGDIIITHRGTLGQIVFIPQTSKYERYVISQSQFKIRCNDKVLPEYIVYYFHTHLGQNKLLSNASQVGVPALARPSTTFQKIEIEIPDVPTQRQIVSILQKIHDKIALNTAINENLEQQAQAIYAKMFIENSSEMWKKGLLSDIAVITMGQSPKGDTFNETGNGAVFYQGRADFGFRFPTRRLYTIAPKRIAMCGDALMSVRAPVGDLNVAYEECCIGRGLAAIHSKDNHQSFVLYMLYTLKNQLDVFNGEGTVFGSINKASLNSMEIVIPPKDLIDKFECIASSIDRTICNNHDEICKLQAIRDSLLPKLMNGEIDVSQIQI